MPADDPAHLDARRDRVAWIAAGSIFIAALLLRLLYIGAEPFDLDEYWNLELTTGRGTVHESVRANEIYRPPSATGLGDALPWWRIPGSLDRVTHPPLFSILLRGWREAFGEGDAAARTPGALLSALAVLPLYAAARNLHGRGVGLWAAALFAVSGAQVDGAQQVRPYPLLIFLCTSAVWLLSDVARFGLRWWKAAMGFALCLAAVLTHYFAAPFLLALAIEAAARLKRDRLRLLGVAAAAGVAFAAIWGPMLLKQRAVSREAAIWVANRDAQPVTATLLDALAAPARLFVEPPPSAYGAACAASAFFCVAVGLAARRRWSEFRPWLLLLAATIGFTLVLDLANNTAMLRLIRYSLLAGPAVFVLAVLLGARWRGGRAAFVLPAFLLILCVVALPLAYRHPNVDFRPMAAEIDRASGGRDGIVVFHRRPGWTWHAGFQWVTWSHYSALAPDDSPRVLFLDEPAPPAVLEELRRAGRFVLVGRVEDEAAWLGAIPGASAERRRPFPGAGETAEMRFDAVEGGPP